MSLKYRREDRVSTRRGDPLRDNHSSQRSLISAANRGGRSMGCEATLLEGLKPLTYLASPVTPKVLQGIFMRHNRRSRREVKTTPRLLEALCEYINQFRRLPSRIVSSYEAAEKAGVSRSSLFYYLGILKGQGLFIQGHDRTLYCFRHANVCLRCRIRYPKDVHFCPVCGKATRKRPRRSKWRRRYVEEGNHGSRQGLALPEYYKSSSVNVVH